MFSQYFKNLCSPYLSKYFLVGSLISITLINPFNVHASLNFNPNNYSVDGKTAEQCERDLKAAILEYKNMNDRFEVSLKDEKKLHVEILNERKKGISYLKKHSIIYNKISKTSSDLKSDLAKTLKDLGNLPAVPSNAQLAKEWKSQNILRNRVATIKKVVCNKLKAKTPMDKSKIDFIKKDLEKEEKYLRKINSFLINLIKINSGASNIVQSDLYNVEQLKKYKNGIYNISKLLKWNYIKEYYWMFKKIEIDYKKLENIKTGISEMIDKFNNNKSGKINIIPDMLFVHEWNFEIKKNYQMEMQLIRNSKSEIEKDKIIKDIVSYYPKDDGSNLSLFRKNIKAEKDWNMLLKIKERTDGLIDQYRSTVKAMKNYLEGAKKCLAKIQDKNQTENRVINPKKRCERHRVCDKYGFAYGRVIDLDNDGYCDDCGGKISGERDIITTPGFWVCDEPK